MLNRKSLLMLSGIIIALTPAIVTAETCSTLPSCTTLGFTKTSTSYCSGKTYLKCPFGNYYFCSENEVTCATQTSSYTKISASGSLTGDNTNVVNQILTQNITATSLTIGKGHNVYSYNNFPKCAETYPDTPTITASNITIKGNVTIYPNLKATNYFTPNNLNYWTDIYGTVEAYTMKLADELLGGGRLYFYNNVDVDTLLHDPSTSSFSTIAINVANYNPIDDNDKDVYFDFSFAESYASGIDINFCLQKYNDGDVGIKNNGTILFSYDDFGTGDYGSCGQKLTYANTNNIDIYVSDYEICDCESHSSYTIDELY